MGKNQIKLNRNGFVDLCRFVFMLLIMAYHLFYLGAEQQSKFYGEWIFVEFFFILTGFYTAKHFSRLNIIDSGQIGKICLQYSLNKFKKMLPYIIIAVAGGYAAEVYKMVCDSKTNLIFPRLLEMPLEMGLLSTSGAVKPAVVPIWYLSAMFITLPVLCIAIAKLKTAFTHVFSWIIPVIYYGQIGVRALRGWPHDLLRAFSCMALGCCVFVLADRLSKCKINGVGRFFITLGELTCLIAVAVFGAINKYIGFSTLALLAAGCVLMLSGKSFTAFLRGSFFRVLGELSLPMFLLQWPVASWLNQTGLAYGQKLPLYFGITIVLSLIICLIVKKCKAHRAYIKRKKALTAEREKARARAKAEAEERAKTEVTFFQ